MSQAIPQKRGDSGPPRAPADETNGAADGARSALPSAPSDVPPPIMPRATEGSFYWRLRGVLKTVRPHQWVKNVFVLAPVVFAKDLFVWDLAKRAGGAFAVFCLLAGAVYTMNDIVDVESDRVHPVKRNRPIASGRVPLPLARALVVLLVVVAMAGALYGPPAFAAVAAAYFLQNIAYSFWLKKIAYVDVALIALGFVLRVVAGGLAVRIYPSGYLVVCTALLALFLGFGKRRHELAGEAGTVKKQRAALSAYDARTLTGMLAVTGVASVATYVAYTIDPDTRRMFHSDWLWLTTPFVVFGVVRFLQLVRGRPKAESPTQEMLRDVPFVVNLLLWVFVVFWLVYQLQPGAVG
jgi:4-hydroxybenzoate polyprenyltransferase